MNLIIQKQEDTIAQLQLAVEHYLESGDLETALAYSELFKLNCEAYKFLVGNKEVKEEKPVFRFGQSTLSSMGYGKKVPQELIEQINTEEKRNNLASQFRQQIEIDKEVAATVQERERMRKEIELEFLNSIRGQNMSLNELSQLQEPPTRIKPEYQAQLNYENQMRGQYIQQQPQQPVVSQYSYGDGQENPKIRANDAYGNWGGNGEPNEIITPPQQLINNYLINALDNESNNLWDDDPRRNISNGFVPQ